MAYKNRWKGKRWQSTRFANEYHQQISWLKWRLRAELSQLAAQQHFQIVAIRSSSHARVEKSIAFAVNLTEYSKLAMRVINGFKSEILELDRRYGRVPPDKR